MKLLFLIAGLALGFGGGVYWGVHHPVEAAQLAQREEEEVLKLKVQAMEKIKQTLDRIIAEQKDGDTTTGTVPRTGFVSGRTGPAKVDPELLKLREEQEQQLQQLKQQLQAAEKD